MEPLGSREVYANPWMVLREDSVRHHDGRTGIFGVVDKPTFALIIAAEGDRVATVEQYRYPLGRRSLEFPQGTAPQRAEVPPRELAARELAEETGLRAARWTALGRLDLAPGMTSQVGHSYLATELTHGAPAREATEADMRVVWLGRAELERRIVDATITDSPSLAAYAQLLLHERVAGA